MILVIKCKDLTSRRIQLSDAIWTDSKGKVITRGKLMHELRITAQALEQENFFGVYLIED